MSAVNTSLTDTRYTHRRANVVRASITIRVAQDNHIARLTPRDVDSPVVCHVEHSRLPKPFGKNAHREAGGSFQSLSVRRCLAELFGLNNVANDLHTCGPLLQHSDRRHAQDRERDGSDSSHEHADGEMHTTLQIVCKPFRHGRGSGAIEILQRRLVRPSR
jgi:hypothetical protein